MRHKNTIAIMVLTAITLALIIRPLPARAGASYTITLTPSVVMDMGTNQSLTFENAETVANCIECSGPTVITAETSSGTVEGPTLYSTIRGCLDFDTSSLGSNATIIAATLKVAPTATHMDYTGTGFIRLVTQDVPTEGYTYADYDLFGSIAQAQDIPVASLATNTYSTFSLNSQGLEAINKTGVTHFGVRTSFDVNNTAPVVGTDPALPDSGGVVVFLNSPLSESLQPMLTISYTLTGPAPTPTPKPMPTPKAFAVTIAPGPRAGIAPLAISISYGCANGQVVNDEWTINGAKVSTALILNTVLATPGTYTVILNATDSQGVAAQSSVVFEVSAPAPQGGSQN